jgi:hypothetical protein
MYAEVPLPSVIMPLTPTMGALPSTGPLFYIQAKFDLHVNMNICMDFNEVHHQELDKFQEEIRTLP